MRLSAASDFPPNPVISMLARDEVEAYMFGRWDERLAVIDLLIRYLEDPRTVEEVLDEIIRIIKRGT